MSSAGSEGDLSSAQPAKPEGGTVDLVSRAARVVLAFFLGHGALLTVQTIAGFFLLRRLSLEAYAQFGLAYGFQVTMGTLMDLGFVSTIIPLVGENRDDRTLVGRYVRAAKHLRDRTFLLLSPFAILAMFWIMHKHQWGWGVQAALVLSVLLSLYSSGRLSYFSTPLLLFRRLRELYVPQTLSATARLAAYILADAIGTLNSWVAAGLNAINTSVSAIFIERKSRHYLKWPEHDDLAADGEVFRCILPAMPAIIFAAFQAQISLFLIGIFGQTSSIAEVAAIGRLNQFFAILMTFNVVVIEPHVARLTRERLLKTYLILVAATAVFCTPIVVWAFVSPSPFIWLLGARYASLGNLVGFAVLAGSITHTAQLMWIMNRGRKWLFWSGTILEIVLLLAVQSTYLALVGIHTTRQAIFFNLVTSFCYVVCHVYVGFLGFLKGPRELYVKTEGVSY
jgi:O-antigen/teichoic acid export membrane protein